MLEVFHCESREMKENSLKPKNGILYQQYLDSEQFSLAISDYNEGRRNIKCLQGKGLHFTFIPSDSRESSFIVVERMSSLFQKNRFQFPNHCN